ncbi:helix-turn-helix transcriptional regulator [Octadecabacter sp. 1_MG-2023]|uniref:helix-turn-helix domain-containing protein n=1 Tax=unclassified Octadecabacter TaxID=196158 RepID=UPI001C09EC60|nr:MULTISPECIES: helix-turn-helix transcriptional regulator [unclassified Octadecabacter]MBU2994358.1 helix-turn-helix domain-containing protein [Octadecabacter sp. B2R22]MDO6734353.1 helix-turn-helix transcriptional regulator [Octadecabacter sp. 1_MG-2023]
MTRKVPNNIAKLRKDLDWSQDTLAGRVNMSVTQLSRLERGVSSLTQNRITAFSQVFEVEPYELFRDAMSKEKIELNLMRDVIVQLEEMLLRLDMSLTPQQRGDLVIELYRLETGGLDEADLSEHVVNLKRFEGMVKALT